MLRNPALYEINTRVWIKQFGCNITLADIPVSYFEELAAKGIELIWLMGIWKNSPEIIEEHCFSNELVSSYKKALEDWTKADVIGSPYAIDDYIINPSLGTMQDLERLRENINKLGMKLILDFVPNHFSTVTKYLKSHPDVFLQADSDFYERDSFTFFKYDDKIFAHGRDPLFPAWTDTVQVNYFSQTARDFMSGILLKLTEVCDGVRCDMSMLPLNNVFRNTWIGVHSRSKNGKPGEEFWKESIQKVKKQSADFLFIGEAYWDLEWTLQQHGFDFTYDKRLLDRLLANDTPGVKAHLSAEKSFQEKSIRFIENHDEKRAITSFGKMRSLAAATVMSTVIGMKLYYDGQFTGRRIKLPVQLSREPVERVSPTIKKYYEKLLEITNREVFKKGNWDQLYPLPAGEFNHSYNNIFAWQWKMNDELIIVIINYSDSPSQCRLKFNHEIINGGKKIILFDLLNNNRYFRSAEEITTAGLFVELKAYNSHIFSVTNKTEQ